MRHLGLLFGATPFDFWSRGQICGHMAGQPTGYEFAGLLLKGRRQVLVALQLFRPVAGRLPDDRVCHTGLHNHSVGMNKSDELCSLL